MPKPGYKQTMTPDAIRQRKEAPLKHGGEAAVKAIQHGKPFTGMAAAAEADVYQELAEGGTYSLVEKNAVRLQAACDLYWAAITKAAEDRDLNALDRYISRFGWLAGTSLRAWAQVRQDEKDKDNISAGDVLAAIREQYGK